MKILGIIPARYHSTRLKAKVLAEIDGKTMIQRVYEQAVKANKLDKILIATDSKLVFDHCQSFAEVVMTDENHQSGTERCAEVALQNPDFEVVINIQGDEPFILPKQIDLLASNFNENETQIATLAKQITDPEEISNPSVVKVVFNKKGQALYFSRAAIPFSPSMETLPISYFKHVGMYGYRRSTLLDIAKLPPSELEQIEKLEQLRWLQNNYEIQIIETLIESHSVDTEADLEKARWLAKNPPIQD